MTLASKLLTAQVLGAWGLRGHKYDFHPLWRQQWRCYVANYRQFHSCRCRQM